MTLSVDGWTQQNGHIGIWGGFKEIGQRNFFQEKIIPSLVFSDVKWMDFFQLDMSKINYRSAKMLERAQ